MLYIAKALVLDKSNKNVSKAKTAAARLRTNRINGDAFHLILLAHYQAQYELGNSTLKPTKLEESKMLGVVVQVYKSGESKTLAKGAPHGHRS